MREFVIEELAWVAQFLRIAIMGEKGAGKSTSLIRILLGIQAEVGGRIGIVDTDARRTALIAGRYGDDRGHGIPLVIHMSPPYDGESIADAVHALVKEGCTNIGIDDASREHNGVGGYHDIAQKATEVAFEKRLARWERSREGKEPEPNAMTGWKAANPARRVLISYLATCPAHVVLTFDAKERIGVTTGKMEGFAPYTGKEILKPLHALLLLLAQSNGKPSFRGKGKEADLVSIIAALGKPSMLDESTGRAWAKWALHGPKTAQAKPNPEPVTEKQPPAAGSIEDAVESVLVQFKNAQSVNGITTAQLAGEALAIHLSPEQREKLGRADAKARKRVSS